MNNEKYRMLDAMDQTIAHPSMRRFILTHQDSVIDWKHGFKDGWIAANLSPTLDKETLDAIYKCVYESPMVINEDIAVRHGLMDKVDAARLVIAWYSDLTKSQIP